MPLDRSRLGITKPHITRSLDQWVVYYGWGIVAQSPFLNELTDYWFYVTTRSVLRGTAIFRHSHFGNAFSRDFGDNLGGK